MVKDCPERGKNCDERERDCEDNAGFYCKGTAF